jgi:hypothetical protein
VLKFYKRLKGGIYDSIYLSCRVAAMYEII